MVDVGYEPYSLTYRLVGTREAEARGHNPTGKSVFDNWDGRSKEDVLENYRLVIETKCVLLTTPIAPWIPSATGWRPERSFCRCRMMARR